MPSPGYKTVWEFNASIISDAERQAFNAFVAGKDNHPEHFAVQFDFDNPAHWLWLHNNYQHPTINNAKELVFRLDDDDLNLHSQSQLWANDTGAGLWNQIAETGYRFSVYDHSYEFSFKMFLPRGANAWLGDTQWLNVLQLHKLESGYRGPPPIGVYIDKDKPGGEAGKAYFHLEARDESWTNGGPRQGDVWTDAAIETNKWYTHTIKYTQAEQGFLSWQLDGKTLFSKAMDLGFHGPSDPAKLLLPTFGVYNHSIPGIPSPAPRRPLRTLASSSSRICGSPRSPSAVLPNLIRAAAEAVAAAAVVAVVLTQGQTSSAPAVRICSSAPAPERKSSAATGRTPSRARAVTISCSAKRRRPPGRRHRQ